MLCSLTLNGVVGALRQQTWKLGQQYRVVTVSFDPEEKPELAAKKQRGYLGMLDMIPEEHAKDWPFLTGDKKNIDALSDALGFKFRWDASARPGSRPRSCARADGKITRYLYGVRYPPRVRLALFKPPTAKWNTFDARPRCYAYDTSTKSYRVFAVPSCTSAPLPSGMLVILLTMLWRRDLRHAPAPGSELMNELMRALWLPEQASTIAPRIDTCTTSSSGDDGGLRVDPCRSASTSNIAGRAHRRQGRAGLRDLPRRDADHRRASLLSSCSSPSASATSCGCGRRPPIRWTST
jgi:protein SCO1/2